MAASDPQAKIDRADKHIRALARMILAFRKQAYVVEAQPAFWSEPLVGGGSADVLIIFAAATEQPPSLLWGPVIGDIVHGLRSALDQVAWNLSVAYQATRGITPPPDPIPPGDRWRDIAFPICRRSQGWNSLWGSKMWAADPALRAAFERFQPYFSGKNPADREPLAVLDELWNIDKHRHLHLVNSTIELRDVISTKPFPGIPDIAFEVISKTAPGPLVGPTEIGRARMIRRPDGRLTAPIATGPDGEMSPGIIATSLPQVHMNPDLAVDVAFDQGPPAYGGSVLKTLRSIRKTVQNIVSAV
ncbi:MAG TPA: hypothetical protein VN892_13500 [Solirubrobacteraceae bacterium]|nr:hypothetical protein [Solirubrobacteraceae bacterium]